MDVPRVKKGHGGSSYSLLVFNLLVFNVVYAFVWRMPLYGDSLGDVRRRTIFFFNFSYR